MVRFGFATAKDVLDRAMNMMEADRGVSLLEVLLVIAGEWGFDENGCFLRPKDLNREQLRKLYVHHGGDIRWLAETLGVDRGTIYYNLRRCGIALFPVEERKRRPPRKRNERGNSRTVG